MVRRNNTKTIHQMRVAFKRFRYMSELLQTMLPRLTKKHLRRMQEYQSMMGDIQDMESSARRVEKAGRGASACRTQRCEICGSRVAEDAAAV